MDFVQKLCEQVDPVDVPAPLNLQSISTKQDRLNQRLRGCYSDYSECFLRTVAGHRGQPVEYLPDLFRISSPFDGTVSSSDSKIIVEPLPVGVARKLAR